MTTAPAPTVVAPASDAATADVGRRMGGSFTAPSTARIARSTLLIGLLAVGAVCLVAVVVGATMPGTVRGWLHYPFAGLPARPSAAVEILVHNLRAVGGVFGLLLITQAACRRPGGPSRTQRVLLAVGEIVVAVAVAENIVTIGAAVGAYGHRMIAAMLPHGPVEVTAYALALASYWHARRQPLPARETLTLAVCCGLLLAIAAALETFA